MEFKQFRTLLQEHFAAITKDATHLFEVEVDKDELWNLYLDSFPAGTNEIYRKRREFDCSCCRHFIKTIGNAVVIENGAVHSIWDFQTGDSTYQPVVDALSAYVNARPVSNVYYTRNSRIGTHHNFDQETLNQRDHFYLELPNKFVSFDGKSEGDYKGGYRDTRNVFKRSLDEITEDSVLTVLELIGQNSLYRGEEWKALLESFLEHKRAYKMLPDERLRDLYAWEQSAKVGAVVGKIRNHSIGTLLVNISEGMELGEAVSKYEAIVAPSNYKRPKAIYTQKMLEAAQKKIQELGYMDSLPRRFATLDDITVNNILFSNRDVAPRIAGADVFADMAAEASSTPKKFDRVEEIGADDFVKNVLPTAKQVEVYLENKHAHSMVSLIAPQNRDAKTMFKWNNGFGWAYSGNITDSMKENVKAAGGKVDGVLRFSIQWNDGDEYNDNDFDAHCVTPNNEHIYFANTRDHHSRGELDVDITHPSRNTPAVENITWPIKDKMPKGTYLFYVHNFCHRGGRTGFKAEIEFDGQIFAFEYNKELRLDEKIHVAKVTLLQDGTFSIAELLPSTVSSREVWGLKTNQFVPASVVMYSPNYWDEQDGIGHRHYFFMLKGCINPESPNGFYNEFLRQDLMEHKHVLEALGSKMRVADVEDQLSGVGFSATKRADLIVRVTGATKRLLKIKF